MVSIMDTDLELDLLQLRALSGDPVALRLWRDIMAQGVYQERYYQR
jgi:hypothetical protein